MTRAVLTTLVLAGALGAQSRAAAAGFASSCEPRLRRYLETAKSADDGQWAEWSKGGESRERLCLALNDLLDAVDRRGRSAVDKADRAVGLAVQLGVAGKRELPAAKGGVNPSSPFSKDAPYAVMMLPEPPSADAVAKVAQAAQEYRQAVIDFAEEMSRRCSSRALMDARGVGRGVKADFCAVSKRRRFVSNQGYEAALLYLTNPGITDLNDNAARPGAALSRFDFRLRNLLAVRADAVRILGGGGKTAEGDLSPETLKKVQSGPEYQRLRKIVNRAAEQ